MSVLRLLSTRAFVALPAVLLAGCNTVLLHPSGAVAAQQSHLIVASTVLMLLIVVPVIALTLLFAWRYRQSNTEAVYAPDWDHSTQLELVIWAAPLLIIIALGALTWISSHTLDPYRPLKRGNEFHAATAGAAAAPGLANAAVNAKGTADAAPPGVGPLVVEVVALDWKWLFIYPEQGIAVVNELAAPVDVPIQFRITASSVMNSFFIPALAGQIYAMPGMQTQLNAVINEQGEFEGFSANYSGAGFSGMHFKFHGLTNADFDKWVESAKSSAGPLDAESYQQLARPSERDPVRRYSAVADGLYEAILTQCVKPCRN
jgi:cytochrome o ubiquinol oxidase subunit 2